MHQGYSRRISRTWQATSDGLMQKHRIIFRVTDHEYRKIIKASKIEDMTVSDYVRKRLNDCFDNHMLAEEVRKLRESIVQTNRIPVTDRQD